MECEKCKDDIPVGEESKHLGKTLCEDCYIVAISPLRTCDVTAVHAAKKHRESLGQTGVEGLTELQKNIYNYIKEKGKATKPELAKEFGLKEWELERQFSVMRHCEVLKGKKEGDKVFLVPFDE